MKTQKSQKLQKKVQVKKESKIVIDLTKGKLMYDQVLIEPVEVESSVAGLVDVSQYEDKREFGRVLLVGNGRLLDNGTVVSPIVKAGDIVLFQKYSAQKIRVKGQDLLIIREEDIFWIE